MAEKKISLEAKIILENLEAETLEALSRLERSKHFKIFFELCHRYAGRKRNELFALPMGDERTFMIETAKRRGAIEILANLIDIIKGAEKELGRRGEK